MFVPIMGRPRKQPADIVLERLRQEVPVILVYKLNSLINKLLRTAKDDTQMPAARAKAIEGLDKMVARVMDVLGQPQRPKVAQFKKRRGGGAIDYDGVINVPSEPSSGSSVDLVPVSESSPPPTSPDLAQFM